jgi:hypothetical protein
MVYFILRDVPCSSPFSAVLTWIPVVPELFSWLSQFLESFPHPPQLFSLFNEPTCLTQIRTVSTLRGWIKDPYYEFCLTFSVSGKSFYHRPWISNGSEAVEHAVHQEQSRFTVPLNDFKFPEAPLNSSDTNLNSPTCILGSCRLNRPWVYEKETTFRTL